MMRTTDGKLCILDFGLMTEITEDQRYGCIEAIAHLLNRDYTEIGQDFINLDFIPKGTDTSSIVPALTKVFDVALAGGGAKSINFQELAADLAQITFDYPFRIPPYFALVIRAISVLEGIALVGNPNFAIIDEAFPYIARRLLTDKSPRLRKALRYMVYGRDGEFDAENLIDLLQALEKFSAIRDNGDGSAYKVDGVRGSKAVGSAGDFAGSQKVNSMNGEAPLAMATNADDAAVDLENDEQTTREALLFFFGSEGEVFREFMLEEVVNVVDASSRGAVQELTRSLGLGNFPIPGFFKAINPDLTDGDRRVSLLVLFCCTLTWLLCVRCRRWFRTFLTHFCVVFFPLSTDGPADW
jgi:aarF domain-containing kinase